MKAELLWLERRAVGEPRSSLPFSLSSPSGQPLVPGESLGLGKYSWETTSKHGLCTAPMLSWRGKE